MLKRWIFIVGILCCIYPVIGEVVTNYRQKKVLESKPGNVLGSLEIPKIEVCLPIYNNAEEDALHLGVGHIEAGKTHELLVGHRGLPHATLLVRLGELCVGDLFYVTKEKEQVPYQVAKIQVLKPQEVNRICFSVGTETVSIITCTPYGLNTHRLVVTGERVVDG